MRSRSFQQDYCRSRHSFAPSERAHSFRARHLDIDQRRLDTNRIGQPRAHRRNIRRQARRLSKYRQISVGQPPSPVTRKCPYLLEETDAVRALIAWVLVREMAAQVTLTQCAQNCVSQGMGSYVSVRVAAETEREGHGDTSQDKSPPRP